MVDDMNAFDDQTRSWSTRIARTQDPYVERPLAQGRPIIGNPVEERRTDGDRHCGLVPAKEWLARPDHNDLRPWPRQGGPPQLPRHSQRDHLSDNHRNHALFDTARPDLPARVRVTQRTGLDDPSLQGRRRAMAQERVQQEERRRFIESAAQKERLEAAEANELLELRSLGIRAVLAKAEATGFKSAYYTPDASNKGGYAGSSSMRAKAPTPPPPSAPPPAAAFAAAPASDRWGAPAPAVARKPSTAPKIDGKPIDLDLSWISRPLERKAGGFRPTHHPSGGDYKVTETMKKSSSGHIDIAEYHKAHLDATGPVNFTMPMSAEKAAQRRAAPIRASG